MSRRSAATLVHLVGKRPSPGESRDGWSYRYIDMYAGKAGKDVYRARLTVVADLEKCLSLILGATCAPQALAA